MSRARFATWIALLSLWALLIYGASSLRHLQDATGHSVCGPWGCGPPTGALLAMHMVWLAVLLPPTLVIPAGFQLSPPTWRSTGVLLMIIGLLGVLAIVGWQWFVWLPQAGPNGWRYIWQRCGFALATTVDVPPLQIFLVGLILKVRRKGMMVASVITLSLSTCGQSLAQHADATGKTLPSAKPQVDGFDQFSKEHDAFFPREMASWRTREEYVVRGLVEGEKLRLKLLAEDRDGVAYDTRVSELLSKFQRNSADALKNRKSILAFDVSRRRFRDQLEGREPLTTECFAAFDGRWFGRWGDSEVNHDWQRSEVFTVPKQFDGSAIQVNAMQYAWIGNGFGWNYLVSHPKPREGSHAPQMPLILGMVYYFDGVDFEIIRGEKAHVGFIDGPTRLVWITEYEVFLEEVLPATEPRDSVYVITAIYHDLFREHPTVSHRATQAIYTRDPKHRPAFFEFEW